MLCMHTVDDAGKAPVDEQALRPGACITAWHGTMFVLLGWSISFEEQRSMFGCSSHTQHGKETVH